MAYLRVALLIFILQTLAFAQEFHFGLKAGVPLTASVDTETERDVSSPIRRYMVGASAELRFGKYLGIEGDGLYERVGYTATEFCGLRCQPGVISMNPDIDMEHIADTVTIKGNSWEFPLLAKFRFPSREHPFVAGGMTVRHITVASLRCVSQDFSFGSGVPGGSSTTFTEHPCFQGLPNFTGAGFTVSGGVEIRRKHLLLQPEFRYTRWLQNGPWDQSQLPSIRPNFISNQAEFLMGIMF